MRTVAPLIFNPILKKSITPHLMQLLVPFNKLNSIVFQALLARTVSSKPNSSHAKVSVGAGGFVFTLSAALEDANLLLANFNLGAHEF